MISISSPRRSSAPTNTIAQPFRHRRVAAALLALAAAFPLAACESDQQLDAGPYITPQSDTALAMRLDASPQLSLAGQRLNVPLLQRFYARHGFEPVWATHPAQASALIDAVAHAGDQGLDPRLFHADLLRRRASFAPLDRELLLSDAFLTYADALARGAVPVEHRADDQILAPEPVDVTEALDAAIGSAHPAAVIDALAPNTPTYRALREALQMYRSRPGDKGAARVKTIEVNLERQRWLPRPLPATRTWVNVADQRLIFYRSDRPVFTTRVVVGEDIKQNQSPEFSATIDASLFDPPWVIPKDIVAAEILPKISADPQYLKRNNMIMLAGGEAEQLPGPDAGLGLLMFDMPNRFDVYLHDTPDKTVFGRDNRRISHGCIRVQDPRQLAALLMHEPIDAIDQGIAVGSTTRHDLPTPVPVFIVYETAFLDSDGTLQFRPDFYDRDTAIWQQLQRRS